MSLYNETNIKNLPQLDQIVDTDFLVVENFEGTNKLKFKDFVVGPTNTSFYNSIKTNLSELSSYDRSLTVSLSSLSSYTIKNIQNVYNSVDLISGAVVSNFNELSARLDNTSANLNISANNITSDLNLMKDFFGVLSETQQGNINFIKFFRWNLSADNGVTDYYRTKQIMQINWPREIRSWDILFLKPIVGINDIHNYTGTLTYTFSTIYFNETSPSTYLLCITSNKSVPTSMSTDYYYPGTDVLDTTPTFACRVFSVKPSINNVA